MQATGAARNDRTNDHTKLMKLIALAGSDNDAEAIAALHHATRILARNGKGWTDIAISFSDAMKKRAGKSAVKR
jgi:hypothetical protein